MTKYSFVLKKEDYHAEVHIFFSEVIPVEKYQATIESVRPKLEKADPQCAGAEITMTFLGEGEPPP